MPLLVTGSIALDTVDTPQGHAEAVLGGSAIYFSLAASLFVPVRVVGVVGGDFDLSLLAPLKDRRIDTRGIEVRPGSRTFRWHGRYQGAMNEAQTVDVQLNVLAERAPAVPDDYRDSRYVFLANTHPVLQQELAAQFDRAELIVCDTMDLWIRAENAELRKLLSRVHGLVINDIEARLLTGETNLVTAGRAILRMGPRFVAIKKGEHGGLLVSHDDLCIVPPYPTERVVDPTGCGDCFAGAVMGYIAERESWDRATLRQALVRGAVVASFVIESFSVTALASVDRADVERRYLELLDMTRMA